MKAIREVEKANIHIYDLQIGLENCTFERVE
jgi:hypothetical protein